MKEEELYEPMCKWLKQYLYDNYPKHDVIVIDSHSERLDKVLAKFNIVKEQANGVDIQIDVLRIAKRANSIKLFFIEAKKTRLTLRDFGQLWAYCKLIDPNEAWLLTSENLGSLKKLLAGFNREDLLDFGDGKKIKKMQVGIWDIKKEMPDFSTIIPKI